MRATDDLQTTITLGSVKPNAQAFSLELSLEMSLPTPRQDEHLPDQIEAFVHHAGLDVERRLFQVLMEKADQELILEQRQGKRVAVKRDRRVVGVRRHFHRDVRAAGKLGSADVGDHDFL